MSNLYPLGDPLLCALIRHHADQAPPEMVRRLLDLVEAAIDAPHQAVGDAPAEDDDAPPAAPATIQKRPAGFMGLKFIAQEVAAKYQMTDAEFNSHSRNRHVAHARQEFYYRAAVETGASWPQIGKFLHRDHTTVMHGAVAHCQRFGLPAPRGLNADHWARKIETLRQTSRERWREKHGGLDVQNASSDEGPAGSEQAVQAQASEDHSAGPHSPAAVNGNPLPACA